MRLITKNLRKERAPRTEQAPKLVTVGLTPKLGELFLAVPRGQRSGYAAHAFAILFAADLQDRKMMGDAVCDLLECVDQEDWKSLGEAFSQLGGEVFRQVYQQEERNEASKGH